MQLAIHHPAGSPCSSQAQRWLSFQLSRRSQSAGDGDEPTCSLRCFAAGRDDKPP
jgi:hypothetical protein